MMEGHTKFWQIAYEQQRFSSKLRKKSQHGSYPILKTDWDILRFETLLRELKMKKNRLFELSMA